MNNELGQILGIPFIVLGNEKLSKQDFFDFQLDILKIDLATSKYLMQHVDKEHMLLVYNPDIKYYLTLFVFYNDLPIMEYIPLVHKLEKCTKDY